MNKYNCIFTFIIGGILLSTINYYSKKYDFKQKCAAIFYANPLVYGVTLIILYRNNVKKSKIRLFILYTYKFLIFIILWQALLYGLLEHYSFEKSMILSVFVWIILINFGYNIIK